MRPFHFRLSVLLKHRKMQQEQAQIKFTQAVTQYKIVADVLSQLQNNYLTSMELLRKGQRNGLVIAEFKFFQNYLDKLTVDIAKQEQVVAEADQTRLECLEILQATTKKQKVVEKLRERRFLQYQADLLREEQKLLDETGLQIFMHGK